MSTRYARLASRVDAYSKSVNARARKLCAEAGLDPSLLGIHPHNAMVSLHYGKPWPGVNYSKVRKVLWLLNERQWLASDLLRSYCDRKYTELGNYEGYLFLHTEGK